MTKPTDHWPDSAWAKVLALILLWIIALSPLFFLDDPAARREVVPAYTQVPTGMDQR